MAAVANELDLARLVAGRVAGAGISGALSDRVKIGFLSLIVEALVDEGSCADACRPSAFALAVSIEGSEFDKV
jgi:hypothetical protein